MHLHRQPDEEIIFLYNVITAAGDARSRFFGRNSSATAKKTHIEQVFFVNSPELIAWLERNYYTEVELLVRFYKKARRWRGCPGT